MQTFHINQILKVQMGHIYMCAKIYLLCWESTLQL